MIRSPSRLHDTLPCGNCGLPLRRLALAGHYARPVEVDLCSPCHLVWFDSLESVRLTGASLLELIGAMAEAHAEPHRPLGDRLRCPRCSGALKRVANRSRWGPTEQLECLRGHGAWQTFAQFLSEKGYMRELTSSDRAALLRVNSALACVNCGASLADAGAAACRYCGSVPGLIDIARLARAVDPEDVTEGAALRKTSARRHAFNCHACGAAVPEGELLQCPTCGATLASPDLRRAHAALRSLAPVLEAHLRVPAPHVRARRLDALRADVERRREWIQGMEESAGQARGTEDVEESWLPSLERGRLPQWARVFAGLLLAFLVIWWLRKLGQ
jgi:Zn-finger nucleic acid-binding protein